MNKLGLIAIAVSIAVASFSAQADTMSAPIKPAQSAPKSAANAPVKPTPASQQGASVKPTSVSQQGDPVKPTSTSQQDRMRECNKQATGKKGDERRAFMKTCLSKKA